MMHPEMTMTVAHQQAAERIRAGWGRPRADRTRPLKALRRALGR